MEKEDTLLCDCGCGCRMGWMMIHMCPKHEEETTVSLQKEKCCEKCYDLSISDDTRTCFIEDCSCHSLQKESEWDKKIEKIVEEGFKQGHIAIPSGSKWLRESLSNLISNREKEIAEEINSFPLSDSMFFDENNWKAGYKALEEFKNYLLKH